jgi:hypothetical protein
MGAGAFLIAAWALVIDILFVGHSLVGPRLAGEVQTTLRHAGIAARVEAQVINGAPLRWNWEHSAEAEGVDGRARLGRGGVDVLILTEAIPLAEHLRWSGTHDYARAWRDAALAANPAAQVFVYETWHDLASGGGAVATDGEADDGDGGAAWRQRLADDLPHWRGIVAALNEGLPAGAPPARLIPAGQAMARMADRIAAGEVEGLTDVAQLFADGIHPNDRGRYLVAMTVVAAVAGVDPRGLTPRIVTRFQSIDTVVTEPMARAMQEAAWEAVLAERGREAAGAAAAPAPAAAAGAAPHPAPDPAAAATAVAGANWPAFAPVTNPALGLNLAGVTDWSVQQPFIDVFKTARGWVGHLPGRWGGLEEAELRAGGWLDERGWPRAIPPGTGGLATLILTDLPEDAGGVAGRYRLTYAGRGVLEVGGRGRVVSDAPGEIRFDYSPGPGSVTLTLRATDPGDPLRDIAVVHERNLAAHARGEVFNPLWLERIRGVRLLRFLDWMATNGSTLSRAADRPRVEDATWTRAGVPPEIMVRLANELGADAWFTLPHLAEDALVEEYARIARDGLGPGLRAWVEFSNEVWNGQFAQAHWAEAEGRRRWVRAGASVQAYAARAVEVAAIWTRVFGDEAPARLVRVIATQTGWLGLEEQILGAPLWRAEEPGRPPPAAFFDAYAVAPYVGGVLGRDDKAALVRGWLAESEAAAAAAGAALGLTGAALEAHVARHRHDLAVARAVRELRDGSLSGDREDTLSDLLGRVLPHHAAVARRHGLALVSYEGGSHVVGMGAQTADDALAAFFAELSYSDGMGALYRELLAGWAAVTDAPFVQYVDVAAPTRWGSWGALRHLGDDNPRWRALAEGP